MMTTEEITTPDITPEVTVPVEKVTKKKQRRSVPAGQMHIQATFNNTIVTFTDKKGNALSSSSAGATGFRGSKKGTGYAAQVTAEKAAEIAKEFFGIKSVDVFVKGVGLGRDSAIRAVSNFNIAVDSISDVTSIAHGGVRPRRVRRT